jgi:hypothetical protein
MTTSAKKGICLSDVENDAVRKMMGTRAFSLCSAGIGGTATKARLSATVYYCINGKMYSKGTTDDVWTLAGSVVPVSSTKYFLLCLDATGTGVVVEGTSTTHGQIPVDANGLPTACPVAELKVETDSTHTFTPGTTNLSAAGITDTYTDISVLPVGGVAA